MYIYTCAYVCVCVCMCMCMFLSLLLSLFVCLCVGLLVCMYVRRALGPSQLRQLLQLSYKCTQLNGSIFNCSWAMILEQRSGLNPTQVQSQQAKQQKREGLATSPSQSWNHSLAIQSCSVRPYILSRAGPHIASWSLPPQHSHHVNDCKGISSSEMECGTVNTLKDTNLCIYQIEHEDLQEKELGSLDMRSLE